MMFQSPSNTHHQHANGYTKNHLLQSSVHIRSFGACIDISWKAPRHIFLTSYLVDLVLLKKSVFIYFPYGIILVMEWDINVLHYCFCTSIDPLYAYVFQMLIAFSNNDKLYLLISLHSVNFVQVCLSKYFISFIWEEIKPYWFFFIEL